MKLGLETESYHLFFQQGMMDIFDFIDKTSELGLDGVEINIIPDVGLHPEFGVLNSIWICPYISRHLSSLNPLLARCRRYSRGER